MRRSRIVWAGVAILVALVGALIAFWLGAARMPAGKAGLRSATTAVAEPAARVIEFAAGDLMTVARTDVRRTIPITGSLRPVDQTLVKAKVAGEIRVLVVREGMPVRAGQEIARIDPTEYQWRVREREAQVRAATAQLEQAQRTFENNRRLLERQFISQAAFDSGRFALDSALGNRDAAVAQLTVAKKAMSDTVVIAPMSGVVAERFAQIGEKVSPDNRIVSIVDLSRMEIEAPVPASDVGTVAIGQMVHLQVEGIDEPLPARVGRISPSTQAGTRSVPVYLRLDSHDPRIRVGLFAQGRLTVGSREGVLAVPLTALRELAGRSFVYAIDEDRLVERDVETGLRDETAHAPNGSVGVVEIRRGLAEGERIVATQLGALRAGGRVRMRASGSPEAEPPLPSGGAAPPAPDTRTGR